MWPPVCEKVKMNIQEMFLQNGTKSKAVKLQQLNAETVGSFSVQSKTGLLKRAAQLWTASNPGSDSTTDRWHIGILCTLLLPFPYYSIFFGYLKNSCHYIVEHHHIWMFNLYQLESCNIYCHLLLTFIAGVQALQAKVPSFSLVDQWGGCWPFDKPATCTPLSP